MLLGDDVSYQFVICTECYVFIVNLTMVADQTK